MKTATFSIAKLSASFVFTILMMNTSYCQPYNENQIRRPERKNIGQSEKVYELGSAVSNIAGMSFKNDTLEKFLYILDGKSKRIVKYQVDTVSDALNFIENIQIKGARLVNPRGLAYAKEASGEVFYFIDYYKTKDSASKSVSRLYRYSLNNKDLTFIDLTSRIYDIGSKEVYGVTKSLSDLYVSFDPSKYPDQVEKTRRGIIMLSLYDKLSSTTKSKKLTNRPYSWEEALAGRPILVKHLPGPGKTISDDQVEACQALAAMNIDGVDYLWGTVGNDFIYLMDTKTCRGIFFFDWLKLSSVNTPRYGGLTFGAGHLWTADQSDSTSIVHKVNVLANLDLAFEGPKHFRELKMQLTSHVKDSIKAPRGNVYHTFCHPFPSNVVSRQGIIPNSIQVRDLSQIPDCKIETLYYYPAGDTAIKQDYTLATYSAEADPEVTEYITQFIIKFWTREYKQFIYPHLVVKNSGPQGTNYLEDDTVLYDYKSDPTIYGSFIERVKKYIADEYDKTPDMDNPYWASRNIVEYVLENYHYPKDEEGFFATSDISAGHYNAIPGNLKAKLSADTIYTDNIIACSGTGSMVCGAIRFIGIPAQWIGVSQEVPWDRWTTEDGDEFLEVNEEVQMVNGHRYNHVWLGDFYKWQRFDATPLKPDGIKFDKKPKEVSQWILMQKSASGVEPRRLIQTIQSEFWPNLHRTTTDCKNKVNGCGNTRYNLLGTYSYPEDFTFSNNLIICKAIQFIDELNVEIDKDLSGTVSWQLDGEWEIDPGARLSVILERKLEKKNEDKTTFKIVTVLAEDLPLTQKSIKLNFNKYSSGIYRLKVIKMGDPAIGNGEIIEL